MRVLITTFTYPPERNGVAECARIQAEGLARLGHEVTVATRKLEPHALARPPGEIEVVDFDVRDTGDAGRCAGPDADQYRRFVAEAEHDVILCHAWQCWTTDLALEAFPDSRIPRKILISHGFSAHLWNRRPRFPWGLGQWARARAYVRSLPRRMTLFDHITFLSSRIDRDRFYDQWILSRQGASSSSIIPNGGRIDLAPDNHSFRARHHLSDAFLVLCVANYTEKKGQETVLRAFLEASLDHSALVFIGGEFNSYTERLKKIHSAHPEARVLFLEKQDQESIHAAHRAANLFALASKSEAQPLVLLDAMGAGTPFVSTDTGAISELPGGVLFHSRAELAELLRDLADNETTLRKLGSLGAEAARTLYNWDRYVQDYHLLLERLQPRGKNEPGELT